MRSRFSYEIQDTLYLLPHHNILLCQEGYQAAQLIETAPVCAEAVC